MIRNGYYIASDACGRDKNGKFVCVCGKCRVMTNEERLKQIDPGTVLTLELTLEELIDSFITDPRKAKRLKVYLSRNKAEDGE